jgi:hypothetical protein
MKMACKLFPQLCPNLNYAARKLVIYRIVTGNGTQQMNDLQSVSTLVDCKCDHWAVAGW